MLRQDLARVNNEKGRIIKKNSELAKNCNIDELEEVVELKNFIKLRKAIIFKKNYKIEEGIAELQKYLFIPRSFQPRQEFVRVKNEKERIIQENWDLKADLRNLIKLQIKRLLRQNDELEEEIISLQKFVPVLWSFQSKEDLARMKKIVKEEIIQQCKLEKTRLFNDKKELRAKVILLTKLKSASYLFQEKFMSIFEEVRQSFHDVCQINSEIPNKGMLDHVKSSAQSYNPDNTSPISTPESSPEKENPQSDENKLNALREKPQRVASVRTLMNHHKSDLEVDHEINTFNYDLEVNAEIVIDTMQLEVVGNEIELPW